MTKEEKERFGKLADQLTEIGQEFLALKCELEVKIKFEDNQSITAVYKGVPEGELQ